MFGYTVSGGPDASLEAEYLEQSLASFEDYCASARPGTDTYFTVQILCGELERQLSRFDRARERFSVILGTLDASDTRLPSIVERELDLVAAGVNSPERMPD